MYGHRAYLLWSIENSYRELSDAYSDIARVVVALQRTFEKNNTKYKIDPYLETGIKYLFIGADSCYEAFIGDVVKEVLLSFPEKITKSEINTSKLKQTALRQESLEILVEDEVRSLAHGNPENIHKYLSKIVSKHINWNEDMIAKLGKIRAVRNIIVHGGSKINYSYIHQAKDKGDMRDVGKIIQVGIKEFNDDMDVLLTLAKETKEATLEHYSEWTKARVFKEMWTSAGLTSVLNYEEFWDESDGGTMVYPKDRSWGWGTSQGLLVQFFRYIHNRREFPGDVLSRFSVGSKERSIILDWLQDQYYF